MVLRVWGQQCDPPAAFRGSVGIKVKLAPHPSDMIWENLEVSSWMQAARLWATSLFSLVLLVLATGGRRRKVI